MNISEYLAKDKEDKQQEIPPRLKTKETNLALSIVSHCMWYSLWSITHHIDVSAEKYVEMCCIQQKSHDRGCYISSSISVDGGYICAYLSIGCMDGCSYVGCPMYWLGVLCVCLYVEKHVVIVCINWSPLFCKTMKYLEFHSHSSMQSDRIGGRRYMQRVSGG